MYGGIGTFTVLVIVALECSTLDGSRRERLNDAVLELVPGFPLAAGWRFQRFCVSATGVLGMEIVATTVGQYHDFTRFNKCYGVSYGDDTSHSNNNRHIPN